MAHSTSAAAATSAAPAASAAPVMSAAAAASAEPAMSAAPAMSAPHTLTHSEGTGVQVLDEGKDQAPPQGVAASAALKGKGQWAPRYVAPLSHRLIVSYDGTMYSGWQLQPGANTVQAEMERALCLVLREERGPLNIGAAGRTDAGVHARGQVVQFFCHQPVDPVSLPHRLNSVLPHDIRVSSATATAPDFNVTASASGKTYHYELDTCTVYNPLTRRHRLHVRGPTLELSAMRDAASALTGRHDFTQLSNDNPERLGRDPVKTLSRVAVVEVEGGLRVEVTGDGFLYRMVRHIVGCLMAVGQGRMTRTDVEAKLTIGASQPPGSGGLWRGYNVVPARGLVLHDVFFPPGVDNPHTLLYPHLPHNEHGHVLGFIPRQDCHKHDFGASNYAN